MPRLALAAVLAWCVLVPTRAFDPQTTVALAQEALRVGLYACERAGVGTVSLGGSSRVCYRKGGVVKRRVVSPGTALRMARARFVSQPPLRGVCPNASLVLMCSVFLHAMESEVWWFLLLVDILSDGV